MVGVPGLLQLVCMSLCFIFGTLAQVVRLGASGVVFGCLHEEGLKVKFEKCASFPQTEGWLPGASHFEPGVSSRGCVDASTRGQL